MASRQNSGERKKERERDKPSNGDGGNRKAYVPMNIWLFVFATFSFNDRPKKTRPDTRLPKSRDRPTDQPTDGRIKRVVETFARD